MTRGLFEVSDAYEQNEICLTKDVTQLKDSLKVHTDKVEDLNKILLEMNERKETAESKGLELKATTFGLVRDVEQARALNRTLNKSLQEAQVELLSDGDEAFEMDKTQALCLKPDLDVSEMDLFKAVVDGRHVGMEEASPKVEVSKM